jgi:hypothetical protein
VRNEAIPEKLKMVTKYNRVREKHWFCSHSEVIKIAMKERLDRITITVGNDLQEALPAKGMDKRLLLLLYPGIDQVNYNLPQFHYGAYNTASLECLSYGSSSSMPRPVVDRCHA